VCVYVSVSVDVGVPLCVCMRVCLCVCVHVCVCDAFFQSLIVAKCDSLFNSQPPYVWVGLGQLSPNAECTIQNMISDFILVQQHLCSQLARRLLYSQETRIFGHGPEEKQH
jgi:hypothetical protein